MRILYIGRDFAGLPLRRRLRNWLRPNRFHGQEGYFEAALNSVASVDKRSIGDLERGSRSIDAEYDCIVINFKGLPSSLRTGSALRKSLAPLRIRKVLLVANAEAGNLPDDDLLDPFDLVFKREHFRDLDRYPISKANKRKLRTTMLSCPLISATRPNMDLADIANRGYDSSETNKAYDVFFSGATTNRLRIDAWNRITASDLRYCGGLQPKKNDKQTDNSIHAPKLKKQKYVELIHNSKINLALDGYGEFTFRHLELWYLGAFMLTTPSIRDLKLPINVVEGMHYTVFENTDDLIDKIKYFKKNDSERNNVRKKGKEMFFQQYSFKKHGEEILQSITII